MRLDSQTPNQKQGFTIDAQHHFTYSGLWLVHLSPPQRTPPRNKGLSVGVYVGGGGRFTSHHWWVRRSTRTSTWQSFLFHLMRDEFPTHRANDHWLRRVACHWQAPLRRTSWDWECDTRRSRSGLVKHAEPTQGANFAKCLTNKIRGKMG